MSSRDCNTLQLINNTLQHTGNTLQHTSTLWNALQNTKSTWWWWRRHDIGARIWYKTRHCETATHLQHTCNALQHTCNTPNQRDGHDIVITSVRGSGTRHDIVWLATHLQHTCNTLQHTVNIPATHCNTPSQSGNDDISSHTTIFQIFEKIPIHQKKTIYEQTAIYFKDRHIC